jgi:hypothetical protein
MPARAERYREKMPKKPAYISVIGKDMMRLHGCCLETV